MPRFELSPPDFAFLTKHVRDHLVKRKLESAEPTSGRSGRFVVVLDEDDRSRILDDLGRVLCEIGLRVDSEPNRTGLYIEALIDTFNSAE